LFAFIRTGILPVGAESGPDAEARQNEPVKDKPPRDDDNDKKYFAHGIPLFFVLCVTAPEGMRLPAFLSECRTLF